MIKFARIIAFAGAMMSCIPLFSQASFSIVPGICLNESHALVGSTGTWSNCTFTWSAYPAGAFFSTSNNQNTLMMLTGAWTYTITFSISSGAQTSSVQHTVNGLPSPSVSISQNSFTTCITGNLPLASKPIALTASGGVTYTWSPAPSPTLANPNGANYTVMPTANSCFSVIGLGVNGCKAEDTACVTLLPRFEALVLPADTTICKIQNNSGQALLRSQLPTPAWIGHISSLTYFWSGASIVTSPLSKTVVVSPVATTIYTLEVRDSLSCVSKPATVTVNLAFCTDLPESGLLHAQIHPNPVQNKMTLRQGTQISVNTLQILSMNGQLIYSIKYEGEEIDLGFLPTGLYYLRLETSQGPMAAKFLKE